MSASKALFTTYGKQHSINNQQPPLAFSILSDTNTGVTYLEMFA